MRQTIAENTEDKGNGILLFAEHTVYYSTDRVYSYSLLQCRHGVFTQYYSTGRVYSYSIQYRQGVYVRTVIP